MVCAEGAANGDGGLAGSTRVTCPAGAPGWMTKALLAGAAGRKAVSCCGADGAAETAGAADMLVSA